MVGHNEDLWLYLVQQPEAHVVVFVAAFVAGLAVIALLAGLVR